MILSSGGCKVSWALRGGTGNAALASASGRLAGGIQTANPPRTVTLLFQQYHRPVSERSPLHSLRQSAMHSADFIDRDGWLHTGDMGIIDQDGYLFIKGRCKNMILSSNGQNIYPEEIEDKLNNMPYISESIVIEKEGKLVALIYPDFDLVNEEKITDEKLDELMTANLKEINQQLPAYSQLNTYKLYNEEFEKTPKRSIKRFLYQ